MAQPTGKPAEGDTRIPTKGGPRRSRNRHAMLNTSVLYGSYDASVASNRQSRQKAKKVIQALVTDRLTRDRKSQSQGEIPGKPRRPYSCATDEIGPVMNPRADRSTHTQGPEALTASRQRITPIGRRAFTIRARRVGGNESPIAATSVRGYLLLLINVLQRAYSIPSARGCGTSAIIPFLTAFEGSRSVHTPRAL